MGAIATAAAVIGGTVLAGKAIKGIKDIWDDCSTSSGSYQPKASVTAAQSKSSADELAKLKAEVRNETEKKEKQLIDNINESMNQLLKVLAEINKQSFGGKNLNININEIQSKNDDLKKEVVGFIGDYMDNRLVLSNHELSEILKEYNDQKRKQKFDVFYRKLLRQAVEKLKTKIEITVHKQEEVIRREIQNRLTEVDKNMQEATKAYEEILHMKEEQDDAKIEEKQIQYCYQYELSEILLEQLGG